MAVVVLGGTGREPVEQAARALGQAVRRYDLKVSDDLRLGEQLEAVRRDSGGEYMVVLGRGVECGEQALRRSLEQLRARQDLAAAWLAPQGEAGEEGRLIPDCLVIRRAALEVVGGFDRTFRTAAVFAELERQCKRQGWSLEKSEEGALEKRGQETGNKTLRERESQAVQALMEGDRFQQEGRRQEAQAAYEKAIQLKEDYVEPIMVLASLLIEKGQASQAVPVLERLVRLDAHSGQAHNYLGLAQYQAGQVEQARRSLARAAELNAGSAEPLINLSVLEWEQGEAEKSLDYLERAAALEPANRDAIVNTALIYA